MKIDEISKQNIGKCTLCPRHCGADRASGKKGLCGADNTLKIARAALHFWEEPCISGDKGSGTVFFSGCTMGCVFCQNFDISRRAFGQEITINRLSEIFLELQSQGALNINLVTPTQYINEIIIAISAARLQGLTLPIIYNTSGYETVEAIKQLAGYIDVYLPDFKYIDDNLARKYSNCDNYAQNAKQALDEMVKQAGECVFDENGIIKSGVIVRHLILPTHTSDSKAVIKYLYNRYGNKIYISIMSQYTPFGALENHPELNRKLTKSEYQSCINYAIKTGIENGFIQEGDAAKQSFIPQFELQGVNKTSPI